jgi:Voltage gated chloride channel
MNPQSSSSDKDDTPTNNDNDMAISEGEIVDNSANTIISSSAVQGGESKHTIDLQLRNEHDSHNDGSNTSAIPSHPENSTGLTSEGSSQSTNIMNFHSATAGGSEDNTNSAVITHDDNVNINNNNIVDRKALMTDDCYCAYSKRNVDAHGRVMTIDDDNSPFCKMPPPGADAFVAWYIDGKFHDEELMKADKDYDDNTTSNRNNEPTEEAGITDEGVLAMEEQRLLEDPVRRFMGPIDISLGLQFRQRRRRYYELNEGDYRNQKAINYDSVSYKKLDTPVWHNYTMEIQRQGDNNNNNKKYGHVINKKNINRRRTTGGANLSRVSQPDMAPTRKQFRTRPFIGCLRKFLSLPRSRANTGPDHPVNTLQQDTRILTRIVLIVLGISVSLLSKAVGESMNALLYWKLSYVTTSGSHYDNGDSPPRGFGTFLGFNLLFVTLAFLPILYRPVAAGSGIAEAKAVLNGIILPKSTDLLTALFKAISVIFTGAASMPIGLEGPLIFMGMALGENAQRFLPKAYAGLKVDRLKRDFAVIGTSCGVTGAFLSPIGGVLFAMEEGASFWNTRLSWSAFAASCVTALTMYVWGLVLDKDFKLDVNSMAIYSGLDGENVGKLD